MGVGDKIKALRKSMGLTQTELGEKVGVKKNAVSKWECGRVEDIPTSTIKALAALFDVPPSYLIDDDREAPTVSSERNIADAKAAFFDGYGDGLSEEEKDELWEDARIYAKFKAQQKK